MKKIVIITLGLFLLGSCANEEINNNNNNGNGGIQEISSTGLTIKAEKELQEQKEKEKIEEKKKIEEQELKDKEIRERWEKEKKERMKEDNAQINKYYKNINKKGYIEKLLKENDSFIEKIIIGNTIISKENNSKRDQLFKKILEIKKEETIKLIEKSKENDIDKKKLIYLLNKSFKQSVKEKNINYLEDRSNLIKSYLFSSDQSILKKEKEKRAEIPLSKKEIPSLFLKKKTKERIKEIIDNKIDVLWERLDENDGEDFFIKFTPKDLSKIMNIKNIKTKTIKKINENEIYKITNKYVIYKFNKINLSSFDMISNEKDFKLLKNYYFFEDKDGFFNFDEKSYEQYKKLRFLKSIDGMLKMVDIYGEKTVEERIKNNGVEFINEIINSGY